MFAVPGLVAILVVDYLKPQEYFEVLARVPLLHIGAALAMLGFVVDLRLGLTRLRAAPHLALTLLFFAWCVVTLGVRARQQLPYASPLLIPLAIYLLVSHAVQSFRMLQVLCGVLLAVCLALAAFGIHQGLAPYGCHRGVVAGNELHFVFDGRPCTVEDRRQCEFDGAEPGADYRCERVGLLGTSSVQGRVRYRGTLEDPNELALALGIALPFAFALYDRKRSAPRLLLVAIAAGTIGLCTIYTQSRGGQLVFLAVLAVYFVKGIGAWRGAAVGALLALPLLLFGGRTGAEDSTLERTECWSVGLHLLAGSPGFGVGCGQFIEHHYLTAHNSYVLAAAELGVVGVLLWTAIVYVAIKIPVQALRAEVAPAARTWALALLASMAGLVVGVLFLSYVYKDVLWVYLGLSGALYHAIRRHDPGFEVTFRLPDLAFVALADAGLLLALAAYTSVKVGW